MARMSAILRDAMRQLDVLQRQQVACCGTTPTECTILVELNKVGESVSVSELGRRLGVDKGWVSRAVDQLATSGEVEKLPSESDRRVVLVGLSDAGQSKCCELEDTLENLSERILSRLSESERATVLQGLTLLYGALQAETQDSCC